MHMKRKHRISISNPPWVGNEHIPPCYTNGPSWDNEHNNIRERRDACWQSHLYIKEAKLMDSARGEWSAHVQPRKQKDR
jgi:hypothetical protein